MKEKMNGAQSLAKTLVNCGVDVCFANPGTSEMHFVAALDSIPGIRPVLCLFEGVVTGEEIESGRRTATDVSPGSPPQRCSTSAPAWPMAWPICTMRAVPPRRSSMWSAIMPPITCNTMPC